MERERSSLKQSGSARRRRGFPALGVGPVPTPTEARFRRMGVLRFVLGTSALCRVWRVARPGRDAVSARTAPDTAPGDRPPFDGGRTRAMPSACLPFLWFENQRFSSSRKSEIFERPRWAGSHADGVGLCCAVTPSRVAGARGTVSAGWRVSAGRTPVFPDWFRRLSYRTFDPAQHKSVASGVKVNAIHARREQRGITSLRQSGIARRQRGVGDATERRRKAPSTPGLSRCNR